MVDGFGCPACCKADDSAWSKSSWDVTGDIVLAPSHGAIMFAWDSFVFCAVEATVLWQVTRSVGGSTEGRAAGFRAVAGGGRPCCW